MKKKYLFSFLLISIIFNSWSQYHTSLYSLLKHPHRVQINPAFSMPYKLFIDIPVIGDLGADLKLPLSYNSIVQTSAEGKVISLNNIEDNLGQKNFFSINSEINLFGVYLSIDRLNLFIYNQIIFDANTIFSKEFISILALGNRRSDFFGKTAEFRFSVNSSLYDVTTLGASYEIIEGLRIGAAIKLYLGLGNISTIPNSGINITTSVDENFPITVAGQGAIRINGIFSSIFDDNNTISFAPNIGFGLDLGLTYQIQPQLTFEASITDLNYITWSKELTIYELTSENGYFFDGVDITQNIKDRDLNINIDIFDTLSEIFSTTKNTESAESYSGFVRPAILSLGLRYELPYNITLGGVLRGRRLLNTFDYSFSLYGHKYFGSILGISASYALERNNFFNFGLGMTIDAGGRGGSQFHLMTDNISAFFLPLSAKQFNLRLGFNVYFKHKEGRGSRGSVGRSGKGRKGSYGAYYSRDKGFQSLDIDYIKRRKDKSLDKDHEFDKDKKRK